MNEPDLTLEGPIFLDAGPMPVLVAICAGAVLGAVARYGAGVWSPAAPDWFPWTTLWISVISCALMGVLTVQVTEVFGGRRLLSPFLRTVALGRFATFSTYARRSPSRK